MIRLEFDGELLFVIVWVLMIADYLWHEWKARQSCPLDRAMKRARREAMKRARRKEA